MYGVIDIGSNTIRLSVYKKREDDFVLMFNKKSMAGLAGYVDKQGNLSSSGIRKCVSVLKSLKKILMNIEVKEVFVFATASLRNVNNTDDAISIIERDTGFVIDLVSGEQEALYGFRGATCFLELKHGVLVDIGGGSTELAFYYAGELEHATSLPMGSLSLYSQYVDDVIPTQKEMMRVEKHVRDELMRVDISGKYSVICGVGGTVRATCKINNDIYDMPSHNDLVPVANLCNMLDSFTDDRKYAVKKILKVVPDRVHTLLPGMAILRGVTEHYKSDNITVSEYGVREGYLYTKLFLEGQSND